MVSSEDFSFPKINYSLPNFAISPSLWRVSSLVYPDSRDVDEREEVEVSRSRSCNNEEEKMDMLWEDFNEELQRVVSNSSTEKKGVVKLSSGQSHSSEKMVELRCTQALNMSRTGTGMIYHDKRSSSSIVVLMKVLKKIFLLKNSPRIKNN